MNPSSPLPKGFRFGSYEVNLATGELRKRGRKVALQDQPFKVLALLLERPGELITRETLQQALWPSDTFVEFDENLNKAVQKLRHALGDAADNPHIIETVPRKGYRFVAAIETTAANNGSTHPVERAEPPLDTQSVEIRRLRRHRALLAVALTAALAGILVLMIRLPAPSPARVRRFALTPKTGFSRPAISPNGRYIVYVASSLLKETDRGAPTSLWIRDLAEEEPREFDGTEDADRPFWSPDSAFIGFAARGRLWKVPLEKGSPVFVCELHSEFLGGTWTSNGRSILYSTLNEGIFEVSTGGGPPKLLVPGNNTGKNDHFDWPYYLPPPARGRSIVYALRRISDTHDIVLHSLDTGIRKVLVREAFQPEYSPTGHLLYGQGSGGLELIMALPFSLGTMTPTGDAFPIAEHGIHPSVSREGTLIYPEVPRWPRLLLTWHDRNGARVPPVGPPEAIESMSLSPDGNRVALNLIRDVAQGGIWILDLAQGAKTRLTSSPQLDTQPVWSPSGKEITFCSDRAGYFEIYRTAADGRGEPQLLIGGPPSKQPDDWSPDGKFLVYEVENQGTGHDLWILSEKGDGKYAGRPFLNTRADEITARFSPDGRYVAYVSDESGRPEVYVRHFPESSGVRQVSLNGGTRPSWCRDGRELFYLEEDRLMAVPITTAPLLSIGQARRLFRNSGLREISLSAFFYSDAMYAASADGRQFLFPEVSGSLPVRTIRVVENWFAEFGNRTQRARSNN